LLKPLSQARPSIIKNINVGRKPGNEQPLENVIKKIPEHYNVGKHKVTEVAQAP
jgi:hypothetical protein